VDNGVFPGTYTAIKLFHTLFINVRDTKLLYNIFSLLQKKSSLKRLLRSSLAEMTVEHIQTVCRIFDKFQFLHNSKC